MNEDLQLVEVESEKTDEEKLREVWLKVQQQADLILKKIKEKS